MENRKGTIGEHEAFSSDKKPLETFSAMKVHSKTLEELKHQEELLKKEQTLIDEAKELLDQGEKQDERVLERLKNGRRVSDSSTIDPASLDQERVFSIEAIRQLCIHYRLRFLSSKYFRDELPYEALSELKALEQRTGHEFQDLRIVAPSERFQLQDSQKDPLLFAALGNGRYYLLHKWGNDLSPKRKWFLYPLRSIQSLLLTIGFLSLLISILLPDAFFMVKEGMHPNLLLLIRAVSFMLIASFLSTAAFIFGITTAREFSSDQWNSRFFN